MSDTEVERSIQIEQENAQKSQSHGEQDQESRQRAVVMLAVVALLVICALFLWLFLGVFYPHYNKNVVKESAVHLDHINAQLQLFTQEELQSTWDALQSVAFNIDDTHFSSIDELLAYLRQESRTWNAEDILLITNGGRCLHKNGAADYFTMQAMLANDIRQNDKTLHWYDGMLYFVQEFDPKLSYENEPIKKIAVVIKANTLIERIKLNFSDTSTTLCFSTRDGTLLYTDDWLPTKGEKQLVPMLQANGSLEYLDENEKEIGEAMRAGDTCVALYRTAQNTEPFYLCAIPVRVLSDTWYLFYLLPESGVNRNMSSFFSYMLFLSVSVILLVMILGALAFFSLYKSRIKKLDKALEMRERIFDLLVSKTSNIFALFSKEAERPLYASPNARSILGENYLCMDTQSPVFQMKNLEGKITKEIRALNRELSEWDNNSVFVSSYIPLTVNDQQCYMVLRLYPVENSCGKYIGTIQDMTKDREREENLKSALLRASAASKAKTQFLSDMSHDIRTPMNAIINMTDFALQNIEDKDLFLEYLDTIKASSLHLLRLINGILEMSRIESGKMTVAADAFSLKQRLREVAEKMRPLFTQKHQSLLCDFSAAEKIVVCTDKQKLSQILLNLLQNAYAYTPENGNISLRAERLPDKEPNTCVFRFIVKDDGIGIAQGELARIFQPFSRINKGSDASDGAGLGLALSSGFAEVMGGTITVESVLGQGTSFALELPMRLSDGGEENESFDIDTGSDMPKVSLASMSALICEDNAVNRKIAELLMRKWGMSTDTAENGKIAVEKFTASKNGVYDIIYMDIHMPEKDGYQAAREIRASAHPQARSIPIVAMTGDAYAEDIELAKAAGMDAHAAKPINASELLELTQKLLTKKK